MLGIKLTRSVPSVGDCCDILTQHNQRFGVPLDFDRMLEYYAYYTIVANEKRSRVEQYIGYSSYEPITDRKLLSWFTSNYEVVGFERTKKGGVSLSQKSIESAIATGAYSKEVNELLKLYSEWKVTAHLVSSFKNIIDSNNVLGIETYDGHRMIVVRPDWVAQNTGRIGAANPGIMNISKALSDIETIPKGWVYLTVDSGQIEPRIIQSYYLKDPQIKRCTEMYNDAYFGYVHYCTILTDEERQSRTLDISPAELSDEIVAKRKKFKTYGNAVMYGSTENGAGDPDKEAFIRYIGGHPNRVAMQREVERQIERGDTIFYTAFGTPIDVTRGASDSYEGSSADAYFSRLVRCGINNRVQGTAADLMRISIWEANRLLSAEAEKSFIIRYTHDSGTFAVHEDDYDKVATRLKEITSYQVEDWIPIYGDVQEGIKQSGELGRLLH